MYKRQKPSGEKAPDVANVEHLTYTLRLQINRNAAGSTAGWITTVIDNRSSDQWVFNSMPGLMDFFATRLVDENAQTGKVAYK